MFQDVFHRLCGVDPVVDGGLGQAGQDVLLEARVEHGDCGGGSLDGVSLVAAGEDGGHGTGEEPEVGQDHLDRIEWVWEGSCGGHTL